MKIMIRVFYGIICVFLFCGLISAPKLSHADISGDIDGNGGLDLEDAITGLQMAGGEKNGINSSIDNDLDGDGRVGACEIVFILQKLAGLRGYLNACGQGFWYDWACYPADLLSGWGLGNNQQEYWHNDRNYDWYVDQGNTGVHSGDNCGPSSATMAARWYDKSFIKTAEDARKMYRPNGGWWYTYDITNYLNHNSIQNNILVYQNPAQMVDLIRQGCILILCIDSTYIRKNLIPEERVDRFYNYGGGHFLVVKGSRKTDSELFFEVHDPNNWNRSYADNSAKGENRHYRSLDLSNSIINWWKYLIVVYPPDGGGGRRRMAHHGVDPATIKHNWGR